MTMEMYVHVHMDAPCMCMPWLDTFPVCYSREKTRAVHIRHLSPVRS